MILTQCAVCATELGLSLGKKCGRCSTRYCGAECQVQHWKDGGHDTLCKLIKRAAPSSTTQIRSTRRQSRSRDGVLRTRKARRATSALRPCIGRRRRVSCAGARAAGRRDTHVSCHQSRRRFCARGRANNLDDKARTARWRRWDTCSLCEQDYRVVACALGWACWNRRPAERTGSDPGDERAWGGLADAKRHEDALTVREAELSMMRRIGASNTHAAVRQSCEYVSNAWTG